MTLASSGVFAKGLALASTYYESIVTLNILNLILTNLFHYELHFT